MKEIPPKTSRASLGRRLWAVLCLALLFTVTTSPSMRDARAQKPAARDDVRREREKPSQTPEQDDDEEVLRVDTDLVHVDVLVTDKQGHPVRGLGPADFKIYEDGDERPLAFFGVERRGAVERPVAVVFLIDISGSMTAEEMERVRVAMQAFARGMENRPASFALMSFGMSAKVQQGFTPDFGKLMRGMARLARETSGLSTHTYDAVDDAVRLLDRRAPRTRGGVPVRRAIVVVTDGFPVGDTVSSKTVIERANAAGTSVYVVTLPSYSRVLASASAGPLPTPLDVSGLAEKTGGSSIYANADDYSPLFKSLAEEVTSTYVLAFYPPEEKRRDGRFHTLRVEGPPGLGLRQSRDGYKSSDK
jgi:VWFA-related protein